MSIENQNKDLEIGRDESFDNQDGLNDGICSSQQRILGSASTLSVASQPTNLKHSSSHEISHFIHEQRKIISTFRAQPWPMQIKLSALKSYKSNVTKYVHQLNTIDTFKDSSSVVFRRLERKLHTMKQYFTIWGSIIKKIEGNFGTSVASFFSFLRWLCALNLIMSLIMIFFVIIPQLGAGYGLKVPESFKQNVSAVSYIFDGKGYAFEYSVIFYGYYDSGQNEPYVAPPANPEPYIGFSYRLPLAYALVSLGLFVYCGIAILSNWTKKLTVTQRTDVPDHVQFCWKVFVSWDYAITLTKTALGKKRQIANSLKETIAESMKTNRPDETGQKWRNLVVRTITNFLVLIILVGSSYLIFVTVENAERSGTSVSPKSGIQDIIFSGWTGIWNLIISFQVQIVIVTRNFVLPILFKIAQLSEKLQPRAALKMMLVRIFVMYFSGLLVLVVGLFTYRCEGGASCCWETAIGQELYKLTFTHLLANWANILLLDCGRWILSRRIRGCSKFNTLYNKLVGPAEFQVASNVLQLVYGQALILFGVIFCPLLLGIGFLKNVSLFYCRAGAVYFFNKPPRTLFRIASTRSFYMFLLLVTMFLCALPVIYAMVELVPSSTCGPFRGLPYMLKVVPNEVKTWPVIFQTISGYVQRPTILAPFVGLLCLGIYFYVGRSSSLKAINKDLKLQLIVEQNLARERIKREGAVLATEDLRYSHDHQIQRQKELPDMAVPTKERRLHGDQIQKHKELPSVTVAIKEQRSTNHQIQRQKELQSVTAAAKERCSTDSNQIQRQKKYMTSKERRSINQHQFERRKELHDMIVAAEEGRYTHSDQIQRHKECQSVSMATEKRHPTLGPQIQKQKELKGVTVAAKEQHSTHGDQIQKQKKLKGETVATKERHSTHGQQIQKQKELQGETVAAKKRHSTHGQQIQKQKELQGETVAAKERRSTHGQQIQQQKALQGETVAAKERRFTHSDTSRQGVAMEEQYSTHSHQIQKQKELQGVAMAMEEQRSTHGQKQKELQGVTVAAKGRRSTHSHTLKHEELQGVAMAMEKQRSTHGQKQKELQGVTVAAKGRRSTHSHTLKHEELQGVAMAMEEQRSTHGQKQKELQGVTVAAKGRRSTHSHTLKHEELQGVAMAMEEQRSTHSQQIQKQKELQGVAVAAKGRRSHSHTLRREELQGVAMAMEEQRSSTHSDNERQEDLQGDLQVERKKRVKRKRSKRLSTVATLNEDRILESNNECATKHDYTVANFETLPCDSNPADQQGHDILLDGESQRDMIRRISTSYRPEFPFDTEPTQVLNESQLIDWDMEPEQS